MIETAADAQNSVQTIGKKSNKWKNPFSAQQRKEEKERRQKKRSRLIVRNLSYKITEELLVDHFKKWGTLEDVNLLKRPDGKLVGCAFVQYETVNQATKAILKGNNSDLLGRTVFVDWAIGKDDYVAQKSNQSLKIEKNEPLADNMETDSIKEESDAENDENSKISTEIAEAENSNKQIDGDDEEVDNDNSEEASESDENDDKKPLKAKLSIAQAQKEKHISNDVNEGCTVFIKNVPFDVDGVGLRKACRKYGPLHYAIINNDRISGHSKGTAFVKFKTKESANLCLQAGTEFVLMDQVLDPHPALSREEIANSALKGKAEEVKDSRNLYLAREGLIMSGSKAAEDVSAADMVKRHKLEQIKTQVLKNLNRFVSRNRLSVHNLPLTFDNEKLKQMAIAYTSFKPHECRVMRENKITPEHPIGKSKGFGFMSFNTHQEALTALRKLNNNPKVFGTQHRPIVAFSIEDRAVYKIKEKRTEKSKLNNPTFQEKLAKRKEIRQQKATGRLSNSAKVAQNDDKKKLKQEIKKLEKSRTTTHTENPANDNQNLDSYVGMSAKPGTSIRMRSNKKIKEQSQEHMKRVKGEKRKEKQRKIKQMHLAERTSVERPKQGRKREHDDLSYLVQKYKTMIDSKAAADRHPKLKKIKRTKWYTE